MSKDVVKETSDKVVDTTPASDATSYDVPKFDVSRHVPQDLQGEKYWESFKDKTIHDVMKSGYEARKMVGDSIRLPKDGDPEKMSQVWEKLGRPKDAADYTYENKLDDIEFDPAKMDKLKKIAWDHGLTQPQFKAMVESEAEMAYNAYDSVTKADREVRAKVQLEMQDKYGTNYEYMTALGKRAAQELVQDKDGAEGLYELMIRNPKVYDAMIQEGKRMQTHGTIEGVTPFNFNGLDPVKAKKEIEEINQKGMDHPARNPKSPDHQEAKERLQNLYKVAFNE